MAFLYPLFLLGLAAIAVPIALHLFRRRTDVVVDFPAVRLLHNAPVEQQRRRRLREWVLLALRVSALALLALAFARPYLPTATAAAPVPVTVVALDASLSMSAPGQWARARQAAIRAIDEAPATHNVALVTFADATTIVVPTTTDRGGLKAAVETAHPGAGGTRYRGALARAAELITSGQGQIVVVTDLQQAGWEASDEGAVPDGIDVRVMEVAAPVSNVAVTSVRREGANLVAGVHNFGPRSIRTAVRVRPHGTAAERADLARETVEVGPQAAAEVRFSTPLPPRGALTVEIDDVEGYQGDNTRYLVLDPPAALPVLIVTAEPPDSSDAGLYVERALGVADDGRAFAPRVVDGRMLAAMADDEFRATAAIVLLGTATLDRQGRERVAGFLHAGGRVLLTLGPDVDVATLPDTVGLVIAVAPETAAEERPVTLVAADTRHPIFRPFSNQAAALSDVLVQRYRRLTDEADTAVSVLARFSGGGRALTEQPVGSGRLLIFASDLDNRWNRFPLNPAFVPWAVETARYLTEGRERRQDFTLPHVPSGIPAAAGVHQAGTHTVAVNPDIRESNPVRSTPEEFLHGIVRSRAVTATRAALAAREQEERQRWWQLGLLVMLVALAGEGLIGRRAV